VIYRIQFKPRAIKDLAGLPRSEASRIVEKIESMTVDLTGDVKKLEQFK
jgi:mRNA interferase RelE/StbE